MSRPPGARKQWSEPTAPHPHPKTMRFSWAQLSLAATAILVAVVFGIANYFKQSGPTSTINGTINGVGTNYGTVTNNFQQPATPDPAQASKSSPETAPKAAPTSEAGGR